MGGRGYVPVDVAIAHGAAERRSRARARRHAVRGAHVDWRRELIRRRWHDAEAAFRRAIAPRSAERGRAPLALAHAAHGFRRARRGDSASRRSRRASIRVADAGRCPRLAALSAWRVRSVAIEHGAGGRPQRRSRGGTRRPRARRGAIGRRGDSDDDDRSRADAGAAIFAAISWRNTRPRSPSSATRVGRAGSRSRRPSIGAMPLNLALAWASLGDADRALQCLERESFLVYWAPQAVWWDPRFDRAPRRRPLHPHSGSASSRFGRRSGGEMAVRVDFHRFNAREAHSNADAERDFVPGTDRLPVE